MRVWRVGLCRFAMLICMRLVRTGFAVPAFPFGADLRLAWQWVYACVRVRVRAGVCCQCVRVCACGYNSIEHSTRTHK